MLTPFALFFGLTVATAVIAYWSDNLGKKLGKKRVSLLGLRPRTTATVLTVASSWGIMLFTLLVLLIVAKPLRNALFRYDATQAKLRSATLELGSLRDESQNLREENTRQEQENQRSQERARQFQEQARIAQDAGREAQNREKQAVRAEKNAKRGALLAQKRATSARRGELLARRGEIQARRGEQNAEKQARAVQSQLQQNQNQLRQVNDQLQDANTRLQNANTRLQNAQAEITRAEDAAKSARIGEDNAKASARRAFQEAAAAIKEQAAAQKQVALLVSQREELRAAIEELSREADDLIQERDVERFRADKYVEYLTNPILLPTEQTLTSRDLPPGLTAARIEKHLISLLEETRQTISKNYKNVSLRLWFPGAKVEESLLLKRAETEPEKAARQEAEEKFLQQTANLFAPNPAISIRFVLALNFTEGDATMWVRLRRVKVAPVLQAGEVLASSQVDGRAGDAAIFGVLYRDMLEKEGRLQAIQRGARPPESLEKPNFYEEGTNELIFSALREIQRANRVVNVRLVAADSVSSVEPVRVRFEVGRS